MGKSSQDETLAVHTATALWHIAMPVVGAVHCIRSGHSPLSGVGIKDHLNLVIEFDLQVYFIAATNKTRQGESASRPRE
jgi:hypothetical protein